MRCRRGAGARPADAHRGRRRRGARRGRPLRGRPPAGGRCVGRPADVVSHQRRLAGQPGGLPGHRPARRARRRAAHRPRQHDRRPRPRGAAAHLRRARGRRRARPRALRAALRARTRRWPRTPGAAAAIVVSPTYYGAAADVAGLARVAHAHGVPLVVDEAWGAHLAFCDALPQHALAAGADLVISSTHKHAGSLTQSAMLHLGAGGRFEEAAIDRALRLVDLDEPEQPAARLAGRGAPPRGGRGRRPAAPGGRRARGAARGDPPPSAASTSSTSAWSGRFGVAAIDPLRVCVDVRATGLSGYEVARRMRRDGDVHVELCGEHVVVAVFGLGERVAVPRRRPRRGARARGARTAANVGLRPLQSGVGPMFDAARAPAAPWGEVALSPRAAFLAAPERVPIAAGRGPDRGGVPGRLSARHPQRASRRAADGGEPRHPAAHARARRRGPRRRRPDAADACSSWPSPRRSEAGGAHLRLERAVA